MPSPATRAHLKLEQPIKALMVSAFEISITTIKTDGSAGEYEDSRVGSSGYDNSGTTGYGSSTTGDHSSPYGSTLDPRVDSGK